MQLINLLKKSVLTLKSLKEASSAYAALLSRNLAYLWLKSFERVCSHSTHRSFTQPTTYVISSANKQCRQFKRTPPLSLFTSGLVLGFLYLQREIFCEDPKNSHGKQGCPLHFRGFLCHSFSIM